MAAKAVTARTRDMRMSLPPRVRSRSARLHANLGDIQLISVA
jgi:hypothetical protein